jgi:hypothetical protein
MMPGAQKSKPLPFLKFKMGAEVHINSSTLATMPGACKSKPHMFLKFKTGVEVHIKSSTLATTPGARKKANPIRS